MEKPPKMLPGDMVTDGEKLYELLNVTAFAGEVCGIVAPVDEMGFYPVPFYRLRPMRLEK